jgi:hypothetical protein
LTFYTKILGIGAFTTYFCLDALTTCAAVGLYGVGAESNPVMLAALGSHGLIGFLALKLAISVALVLTAYAMTTNPGTRITGISALVAIMTGGVLVTLNNASAIVNGTSLFYEQIGISYLGGGGFIALAMLLAGLIVFSILSISDRRAHSYKLNLH